MALRKRYTELNLDKSVLPLGPIPSDLDLRVNLQRQMLPTLAGIAKEVLVAAPDVSVAASVDGSVAETFDFSVADGEDPLVLELVVNDYLGRQGRNVPGTLGVTRSEANPAKTVTAGASDQINVAIAGEVPQNITLGAGMTSGAIIAARIQTLVRALTPASARNLQSYQAFVAVYHPESVSTTITKALVSGTEYTEIEVDDLSRIKKGMNLSFEDVTSSIATFVQREVKDIRYGMGKNSVIIAPWTPNQNVEVGAVVRTPDNYYEFKTGKPGADQSIVFTAGTANSGADELKLRSADGAVSASGTDAIGTQKITLADGDADIADIAAVTCDELVVVINRVLTGAVASNDGSNHVDIDVDRVGVSSNLKIDDESGVATLLGLSTTLIEGTETDVVLPLADAVIDYIQPYTIATGALGNRILDIAGTVRQEGANLVNISGADKSTGGTIGWFVGFHPRTS